MKMCEKEYSLKQNKSFHIFNQIQTQLIKKDENYVKVSTSSGVNNRTNNDNLLKHPSSKSDRSELIPRCSIINVTDETTNLWTFNLIFFLYLSDSFLFLSVFISKLFLNSTKTTRLKITNDFNVIKKIMNIKQSYLRFFFCYNMFI